MFVTMTDRKTGLFSATVASFILDSYKKLSPDSGDQTTFLLGQLSNQLAGFANGTYPPAQPYSPPPLSASIIWVNVLWLLSFILSTTCALFATLMQQWARTYLQVPQIPSVPRERARVRSYLFFGTEKYLMRHAVETAPALLHLSVFLFFVGLVIFFFTIFKMVAIIVLVVVGLFGLVYIALTILPCHDYSCPYRTPMSRIWWYLWHTSLSIVSYCLLCVLRLLHNFLVPCNPGDVRSLRQRIIVQLLKTVGRFAKKHKQRLSTGFRRIIIEHALQASQDIDIEALTWLFQLPALTEKSKIQKFVAGLPGETVVQLFTKTFEHGKKPFREHLSTLLRSCASDTGGLEEHTRRERLLTCLNAVHHVAKALVVPGPFSLSESDSVFNDVRTSFADIGLMQTFWTDSDPSIRIAARSICALLARNLLRKYSPEESELAWLQEVLGKSPNTIFTALGITSTVDPMNIDAYVYGVFSRQTKDLSKEQAKSFVGTLKILTNAGSESHFRLDNLEGGLSAFIQRADKQDGHQREVVEKLRRAYEQAFPPAPAIQETNT
jgi:hypothetical protein